ncbi:hypothetical protein QBC34DRAFT_438798 [Podospora aff. communis PSN243]|uniref:Flavin reductase like domain-containing protein n=1 Tax=Podospora aff. communis PSN243 TaxID=3040156 RepID=A0AAV9GMS4_9PEZI|nr:hypothetical protein QBC34DRAFT_438798 [Podospora aff. communis PSN243]
MLYLPGQTPHNLPHDPFKACVVPRPIGWISTTSPPSPNNPPRHNLAPYSQFTNLTFDPPYVLFAANQTPSASRKDTVRNVEATGKFVWNLATWDLREEVNKSAQQFEYGVDEFVHAGLEKEFSAHLPGDGENPVPMVKRSPVRFECAYHGTLRLPGNPPLGAVDVVIGRVVAVHIADWAITGGRLDVRKTRPIARCGYYEYAVVGETFEMVIPGLDEVTLAGLEGSRERVERVRGRGKL